MTIIPTVRVQADTDRGYRIVNKADFDPEVDALWDPDAQDAPDIEPVETDEVEDEDDEVEDAPDIEPAEFPFHKGGPHWTLSDGSSFQGSRADAEEAEADLHEE